jgi:hypothetical protein
MGANNVLFAKVIYNFLRGKYLLALVAPSVNKIIDFRNSVGIVKINGHQIL